jgi:hypothetical protein
MFDEYARAARNLEQWHASGRRGLRPAGRLRPYRSVSVNTRISRWAQPLYRILYDPDGRPPALRRAGVF